MIVLSILICSLNGREHYLEKLLNVLSHQICDSVEIIIESDNGELPIGEKRNVLLNKSKGKYVCFIDDDDLVSDDYISLILDKSNSNPDVIGFELEYYIDGELQGIAYHSKKYSKWSDSISKDSKYNMVYYRCPNHLNPIKRDIVMEIMYPPINHGEDKIFSELIHTKLITEEYIDKPIYFYYFRNKK